ncbi:HAMP domain-containing sensor histidine kinase [Fervidobacterium nodosum]|uniref:histidine kinase n=1 Tax=Fervidobacterium nodosum (strain ATCC 35602 / DSM 5306 / Rt17-B1) TaxID=381764 RepID=A7HL54_FERNB|nr:HAMP domain-containing sensor histidine kinase [Fervidobacterium nodosum]ABS60637.1 histidine kinase [Fervidobacterium nodosum Rt17-B1]
MKKLKLTTKLSFFNTLATIIIVGTVLLGIYRYFTFVATRNIINDMGNVERSVVIMYSPFGPHYVVTRWDLYVAETEEKSVINDPYGIGFIDAEGFQKIFDRYFYFVKYKNLVLGRDVTSTMKFLYSIRSIFIFAVVFIAISVFMSTYFLSRRNVKDLKDFISEIEKLGGTDLAYRVQVKPKSFEVEELVEKFNDLMERIEREYKAQETFVSAVSHELRTPVANLLGYVSMLKRWGTDDKEILEEAIGAIEESSKEIKEIIENMLLLAKVSTLTQEKIILEDFVSDIITHRFKGKNVSVEGRGVIVSNREGLGIILTILLNNAFTHGAPPAVVSISNDRIDIKNHGEKIPEEEIHKIFDRFYKGKNSNGTGLGLYIAKEIAIKLGLKIEVVSNDEFTVFSIVKNRGDEK